MPKRKDKNKHQKLPKNRFSAATADKYELYQLAVQSPEEDIDFLMDVYKTERGRQPRHFREDFCGTGLLTATWIKRDPQNTAEGFDIDPEPVEWGQSRHFAEMGDDAKRATIHLKDARESSDKAPDVRCAQNFSYWIFKTRKEMLDYFTRVHQDLAEDGIFVVDLHGGPESIDVMEEETELEDDGFTYVWDQDEHWPVTGEARLFIHFRFPDGTEMNRAFEYNWRLWGLVELKEILEDAGFSQVDCYWEGTDDDGESGDGVFTKDPRGEHCAAYVAYLVGLK